MSFDLAIYAPLAPGQTTKQIVSQIDVDPDVTSLTFTTALPGGFADLEVGTQRYSNADGSVSYAMLPRPIDIPDFAHVELHYGAALCWEGRLMRTEDVAGQVRGFSAIGYGLTALTDDWDESEEITRKTSGVLVTEILAARAPLLRVGANVGNPGLEHTRGEFVALTPADALNQITSEGGFQGELWDYWVYEGREVYLQPRVPPAGLPDDPPDYLIPWDERVERQRDLSKLYGEVAVRYQDLDGKGTRITPRVADPSFRRQYGFTRSTCINGGQMRAGVAQQFAVNYLGIRNVAGTSIRITRQQMQGMETPGSMERPPWLVRSGEWVQIGDQGPYPFIYTEYDAMSQVLSVEAGEPYPHGSRMVRQLSKVAGHVTRGTNPTTGARA